MITPVPNKGQRVVTSEEIKLNEFPSDCHVEYLNTKGDNVWIHHAFTKRLWDEGTMEDVMFFSVPEGYVFYVTCLPAMEELLGTELLLLGTELSFSSNTVNTVMASLCRSIDKKFELLQTAIGCRKS